MSESPSPRRTESAGDTLKKVLFVDDEPNLLAGIRRQLRGRYQVHTAESGAAGLEVVEEAGPFPVVVSDMRMPQMDGATFLAKVRQRAPNTVRILLTGQTDIESAISAVNDGQIFRFLLKPCPTETLTAILDEAINQYRLITAEKELLEKTLRGSIKVLTDILGLVNPVAFGRSARSRRFVAHMAAKLGLPNRWQYDIAAMLSQIGCVTLPADLLAKVYAQQPLDDEERRAFEAHPATGRELIEKIPRLKMVALMIGAQKRPIGELAAKPAAQLTPDVLGGQMLGIALAVDHLLASGRSFPEALEALRRAPEQYHPQLVEALSDMKDVRAVEQRRSVTAAQLNTAMVIDEDLYTKNGVLVVTRGQDVTEAMLARLRALSQSGNLREPFRVLIQA
ncbi:MAG: hypothetical protein KatS3mg121_1482 [Gammaproteobacteria bacterium]|nr:MAG: hypothetical protein KatS3mg121_1482 [Gammaproteobacteria bacterium]